MSSTLVVPAGPYFGFDLPALETELAASITERKALNSALQGASVNGESFQFADVIKQRAALAQKQQDLQDAFAYLDPGRFPVNPATNISAATFR